MFTGGRPLLPRLHSSHQFLPEAINVTPLFAEYQPLPYTEAGPERRFQKTGFASLGLLPPEAGESRGESWSGALSLHCPSILTEHLVPVLSLLIYESLSPPKP